MTEDEIKSTVCANICALRKAKGITQQELANVLNYSDKSVSKWERGDGLPDTVVLYRMAEYFGVDVNAFFNTDTERPKIPETKKKRTRVIVPLLAAAIVWLVAVTVYTVLGMLPVEVPHTAWAFLFAAPVTMTVLTVFSCIWWNKIFQLLCISGIIWTAALSLAVSVPLPRIYLVWCIAAVVQVMAVLWHILRNR